MTKHKLSLKNLIPQLPNWGSLLLGMLIGIFTASLLVFTFATSDITLKIPTGKRMATAPSENIVATTPDITAEPEVASAQEPRFDFYTELSKNIPDTIAPQPQDPVTPPAIPSKALQANLRAPLKPTAKPINGYLVRAGYFRKHSDAEALKAKLLLNGFSAKVSAVKESAGDPWFRVVLGPMKAENAAKDMQRQLKNIGVDAVLVRNEN